MFSLSIPSSTTDPHNGVTYYQLQLQFQFQLDINNTSIHSTSSSSEGCWRAFKRYSAFESLHALLLPLLTASNSLSLVSPLPSKYALPLPSLVQTRRLGLEKYLLDITFNDKLLHIRASPAFLDFIQVPSHLRQHLLDYFSKEQTSKKDILTGGWEKWKSDFVE